MNQTLRNTSFAGAAILLVTLMFSGCGKVSDSPLSPLIDPPVVYDFDSGASGWRYEPEDSTIPAGFGVAASTLRTFRSSPGSLRIDLNFTAAKQSFDFGMRTLPPKSLEGRAMSAWMYWDSGITGDPSKIIGKFYVKLTGSWKFYSGPDATLSRGRWTQVTWPVNAPSAELTDIREWGLEIYNDSGPSFYPGVVYIDNVAF